MWREATHVLSRILARYNSHPDHSEWRLVTNFLERGIASPLANRSISRGNESPSHTLIAAREEYEASSRQKGEGGAALEYLRLGVPILPL